MIVYLLLALAAGGVFYFSSSISPAMGNVEDSGSFTNDLGLIDISPIAQHGNYTTTYDQYFLNASNSTGIPFALIKAHAQRESAFKPNAYRAELATSNRPPSASYGLTQILWWKNSNRFQKYGYSDDTIGDGSLLYKPDVNCNIGASIMLDNWNQFKNLRDTINAYNTGVKESTRSAPGNYVNDVIKVYSTIVGGSVT